MEGIECEHVVRLMEPFRVVPYPITEAPTKEAASSIEESLVRSVVHPVGTTTASTSPLAVQDTESGEHPLVAASTDYAKAVEVHRKATEFLRDCEKRLEFAKGEVLEASEAKSQALGKVRALIRENHD